MSICRILFHIHPNACFILLRDEMEKYLPRSFLIINKIVVFYLSVVEYYQKQIVTFQICGTEIVILFVILKFKLNFWRTTNFFSHIFCTHTNFKSSNYHHNMTCQKSGVGYHRRNRTGRNSNNPCLMLIVDKPSHAVPSVVALLVNNQ